MRRALAAAVAFLAAAVAHATAATAPPGELRVTFWFSLRDGCQIARWRRLQPLLPAGGA